MKVVCGKTICLAGTAGLFLFFVFLTWPISENRLNLSQETSRLTTSSDVNNAQLKKPPANPISIVGERDFRQEILVLRPGDTLIELLRAVGTSYREALSVSNSMNDVLDPRKLKAGQRLSVELWSNNEEPMKHHLGRLSMVSATDKRVVVEHGKKENFSTTEKQIRHTVQMTSTEGKVEHSLFEAAREQGVPVPILTQASSVLGHTIDLTRDINLGDWFFLGYEIYDDGDDLGTHPGNLIYVSLRTIEGERTYFRHKTSDGFESYFDENGNSIESGLLKTPVSNGRLSSTYGKRKHPVLGYTRMHRGLDFAATPGTPVLAAGNGRIVERRRNGSFGNYIRIRHDDDFSSAYAHLARYEKTLTKGDRVRRGDIIGYVGDTGLTSGPNLHFEVLKDGRQLNPVRIAAPPRVKLEGEALLRFQQKAAEMKAMLGVSTSYGTAVEGLKPEVLLREKG